MATAFMGTACFMLAAEVWRAIAGYEGIYEVSDVGRVRRISTGRILKQFPNLRGYLRLNLFLRGKPTTHYVAHLVADAFLQAKSSTDQVVRHLNDVKTDNRAVNMARGTYSENNLDAIRNSKFHPPRGSAHYCAKLTEDDVREIRRLYATGKFSHQKLALRFGVNKHTISKMVRRQAWKHVI